MGWVELMRIHHLGIVVKNIEKSSELYKILGFSPCSEKIYDHIQKNLILFLKNNFNDNFFLELIEPVSSESTVWNFPIGYHHICIEVDNNERFITDFQNLNCGKIFTPPIIAPAISGRKIVFAYLYNKTLIEFLL